MPFPLLIPAFFFSSWLLMVFWGMISPGLNIPTAGYPTAMLATIGLWLVVFPVGRGRGGKGGGPGARFGFRGRMGEGLREGFEKAASERTDSDAKDLGDDEIDINSSFSGISRRLTSQGFRGGNVNTNFGGVQLDLRDAALADNKATLMVRAFIGGVEITVPRGWDVQVDVSTTLAGISDERSGGGGGEGAPKLLVRGSATMGGISIKD